MLVKRIILNKYYLQSECLSRFKWVSFSEVSLKYGSPKAFGAENKISQSEINSIAEECASLGIKPTEQDKIIKVGQKHGFTLIELLVVVGIIGVLVSLLLPALGSARESGRRAVCASNLKQIGTAINMYANENNDRLPLDETTGNDNNSSNRLWNITGYLLFGKLTQDNQNLGLQFYCPSCKKTGDSSYNPNNLGTGTDATGSYYQRGIDQGAPKRISEVEDASKKALITDLEALNGWTNHGNLVNALYLDSHVSVVSIPSSRDEWRSSTLLHVV